MVVVTLLLAIPSMIRLMTSTVMKFLDVSRETPLKWATVGTENV